MFFKFLKHTADVKILAKAGSLEELFREALKGMAFIQKSNIKKQIPPNKRLVSVQSPDKTTLLVDFLSEALAQSQINKEVYADAKFLEFSETKLKAEIYGTAVENFDEDIKAATYHEADVRQNEKGEWETILVFDI
jgi:SHS2 domain-containing protein